MMETAAAMEMTSLLPSTTDRTSSRTRVTIPGLTAYDKIKIIAFLMIFCGKISFKNGEKINVTFG